MSIYKNLVFVALLCTPAISIMAQSGFAPVSGAGRGGVSGTLSTGYQSIGINPANLAVRKSFRDPRFTFGGLEANLSFFSRVLNRQELWNALLRAQKSGFQILDYKEKQEAAQKIANKNTYANFDITLLGAAYQSKNKGWGAAFSIKDQMRFLSRFNNLVSDVAFMGFNAPYFPFVALNDGTSRINSPDLPQEIREQVALAYFDTLSNPNKKPMTYVQALGQGNGTRLQASWFREFNLGFGKQLVDSYDFSLYAGGGIRYLYGISAIDLNVLPGGKLQTGLMTLSPSFNIDFENLTAGVKSPSLGGMILPKNVGNGYGFDLGIRGIVKRNISFAFALNNIGKVSWNKKTYKINTGNFEQFVGNGFSTFNIFRIDPGMGIAGSEGKQLFVKSPDDGKNQTHATASNARLGMTYKYFNTLELGFDIVQPLNDMAGNLETTLYCVGGDVRINRLIKLSTGASFGGSKTDKFDFPLGATYLSSRRVFEAGLYTSDLSTYFFSSKNGSTISFSTFFMKVMF